MWVISLAFSLVLIVAIRDVTAREVSDVNAVVTLVTGPSSPYASGAIALGQSLVDIGSKLRRVVMVTPDVEKKTRDTMKTLWEVIEVQPIACNHQNKLDPTKYDLAGPTYKAGIQRWSATCTKFAAFTLTQFERIIFMDSDMLVVGPIDDAIYGFSNASFLAAPETFPPDTFNSGFLVLNPSKANYENIMRHNAVTGSAEGGDQG
jgi:alpha-N-acetylglucosamine transferase